MTGWATPGLVVLAFGLGAIALARLPPGRGLATVLLLAAGTLALLRQFAVAVPLAVMGISLWQRTAGGAAAGPAQGQQSQVRTDRLAMRLDHDTGQIDGDVLSGQFAGRRLSEMSAAELQEFVAEIEAAEDEESLSLLLAYLERHHTAEEGFGTPPQQSTMSEEDAYRVLGLAPGASVEEVRAAYHRLMRRVHPDLGGSSALAAMINAAKEILDPN